VCAWRDATAHELASEPEGFPTLPAQPPAPPRRSRRPGPRVRTDRGAHCATGVRKIGRRLFRTRSHRSDRTEHTTYERQQHRSREKDSERGSKNTHGCGDYTQPQLHTQPPATRKTANLLRMSIFLMRSSSTPSTRPDSAVTIRFIASSVLPEWPPLLSHKHYAATSERTALAPEQPNLKKLSEELLLHL
jgi:hypothetical protein